MHHLQSHHDDKEWEQEGWKSEIDDNEPIGYNGSPGSAVVLKLFFRVGPFARLQIFEQTLVIGSGVEKGDHSDALTTDGKGELKLTRPIIVSKEQLEQALKDESLVYRLVDQAFRE